MCSVITSVIVIIVVVVVVVVIKRWHERSKEAVQEIEFATSGFFNFKLITFRLHS
jgi:uncharacterized membrane protein